MFQSLTLLWSPIFSVLDSNKSDSYTNLYCCKVLFSRAFQNHVKRNLNFPLIPMPKYSFIFITQPKLRLHKCTINDSSCYWLILRKSYAQLKYTINLKSLSLQGCIKIVAARSKSLSFSGKNRFNMLHCTWLSLIYSTSTCNVSASISPAPGSAECTRAKYTR